MQTSPTRPRPYQRSQPTAANYSADLPPYTYQCYEAGPALPCSPYADCSAYDDNDCGYLSSTADQVGYCAVPQPPLWPALLSVPAPPAAGAAASGNVVQPLLFTGWGPGFTVGIRHIAFPSADALS